MKKQIAAVFAVFVLVAVAAVAQQGTTVSSDAGARTNADTSKATVKISGRISDDGKTFVDTEGVTWSIMNTDAVAENLGGHVVLRTRLDAGKHKLEVISVHIDTSAGARLQDAAFRR